MSSLFEIRENAYNTILFQPLSNESRKIENYGLEIICYRATFIWAIYRQNINLQIQKNIFKRKIKNRKGENCACKLCKPYVWRTGLHLVSSEFIQSL